MAGKRLRDAREASDLLWQDHAFVRALLQTVPVAVLVLDAQGRVQYVNGRLEELSGWALEEVRDKDWFETFIPDRDRDLARAQFEVSLRDTPPTGTGSAIVTRGGEERPIDWRRHAVRDSEGVARALLAVGLDVTEHNREGRVTQIIACGADVTDRTRAEEALRESEERLRNILDSMCSFVGVFSPDGTLIEVNRAPLAASGLRREDVIGKPFWETDWWSSSPAAQEQLRAIMSRAAQGETTREDIVARFGDDVFVTVDSTFGPLYDSEGRITQIIGSGVDITDRTRAEEALRESEARFAQAQQIARIGSWQLDLTSGLLTWSDEIFRIFEIAKTEWGASYEAFLAAIHPDDRHTVDEIYRNSVETGAPYEITHRLLMPDGRVKHVHEHCATEYDEAGKPLRSVGTVQDITDRVHAEEALRETDARLRFVLNNAPMTIFALDREGVFTLSEGKGLERVGLAPGENVGVPALDLYAELSIVQPDGTTINGRDAVYRVLAGETVNGVTQLLDDYFDNQMVPYRDVQGQVIGMIGVATVITDRIHAQQALEDSERLFRTLAQVAPVGIFRTDPAGEWTYVNEQCCAIAGRRRNELLGTRWASAVHPDDRVGVLEEWAHTVGAHGPFAAEYRFQRPDGQEIWVVGRAQPELDSHGKVTGHVGTITDITERKQVEEAAGKQQSIIRSIAETLPGMMYVYDIPGERNTYMNPGLVELLERPREQARALADQLFMPILHPDDLARMPERMAELAAARDGEVLETEYRVETGSGSWKWLHAWDTILSRTADGSPKEILGLAMDITGRKVIEEALRESEERFRTMFGRSPIAIALTRFSDGAIIEVNDAFTGVFGYDRDEVIGMTTTQLGVWPGPTAGRETYLEVMARDGGIDNAEGILRRKDGSQADLLVSSHLLTIDGEMLILDAAIDISGRKRAEEELRLTAERLSLATEAAQIGIFDADLTSGTVAWDDRMLEIYGLAEGEFGGTGRDWAERVHPDDLPSFGAALDAAAADGQHVQSRYRVIRSDGEVRTIEASTTTLRALDGTPLRMIGTNRDATERVLAEERVREMRDHLEATLQAIPDLLFELDSSGRFVNYRAPADDLLHIPPEQFLGRHIDEVLPPEVTRIVREAMLEAVERGHSLGRAYELATPAGVRWFELSVAPMATGAGGTPGFVVLARDVSGRKRAEEAVHESEARLASVVANALDGIVTVDEDHRILVYNAAAEAMFGWPAAEMLGRPLDRLLPARCAVSHREHVKRYSESRVNSRRMGRAAKVTGLRADGEEFPIEASISQAEIRGRMLLTVIVRDITEREQAAAVQARLEAQLGEARKMEAIGTLASGIAHDFNNILGAVLGNTELALHELGSHHPVVENLEETRRASRRGAELVRQILTFGSQVREPQRVTSLRTPVEEAVKSVRTSLPPQIELDTSFGADTPNVIANTTQIHQVVVNLCTNAGQAIGDTTGRIDVQLQSTLIGADPSDIHADLTPGSYLRLSVSDTGEGMDTATQERIFEPFFTTKPVGRGTGLGLSVVHGIVKAHGGVIAVTSRPGEGTTFDIYFRAVEAAAEDTEGAGSTFDLQAGSGAHVLYVDDEDALVSLGVRLLEQLGYEVSGHTDPAAALEAVRTDPLAFDLVVTDFSMPGLSGLDLARELSQLRPELPVVLMSGYVTDELEAEAASCGVVQILPKPSSLEELARTIRALTDTKPSGAPAR